MVRRPHQKASTNVQFCSSFSLKYTSDENVFFDQCGPQIGSAVYVMYKDFWFQSDGQITLNKMLGGLHFLGFQQGLSIPCLTNKAAVVL